jgi:predicted peptidase
MEILRKRAVLAIFVLLVLGVSCATIKSVRMDYTVQEKTLALGSGATLRYTLALPPSFSPEHSYPLILALHYGGQVTPYYGKPYLMNLVLPALGELAAIMVAPDCPGVGWTDPRSEKAVLALVGQMQKDFPVDPSRLLITGYSLGAVGTWDFVLKHPDMFSAAIPISGMPPQGIALVKTATPFWVIHSRDDELFAFASVRTFVQLCQSQGLVAELKPVLGLSHYDFAKFTLALREAVPWVRSLWQRNRNLSARGST